MIALDAARSCCTHSALCPAAEPKHLALAINKQPLRTLAALELAVRVAALEQLLGNTAAALAAAAAAAAVAAGGQPVALCLGDLLSLARTVAAACKAAASSGTLLSALGRGSTAGSLVQNH
jgi:hypothetical protein